MLFYRYKMFDRKNCILNAQNVLIRLLKHLKIHSADPIEIVESAISAEQTNNIAARSSQ